MRRALAPARRSLLVLAGCGRGRAGCAPGGRAATELTVSRDFGAERDGQLRARDDPGGET